MCDIMGNEKCEHATIYKSAPAGRFGTHVEDPSLTICKKSAYCGEQIRIDSKVFCKKSPVLEGTNK